MQPFNRINNRIQQPNELIIVNGIKNQTKEFEDYSPECHLCNGDGCSFGRCSSATTWDPCNNNLDSIEPNGTEDWMWREEGCIFSCRKKPHCSKPNPDTCNTGVGGFVGVKWAARGYLN